MTKEYTRINTTIRTRRGEEFVIALDANPTTGYKWEPRFEADTLQLLDRHPPVPGKAIGTGGVERFHFMLNREQAARLLFFYRRPWDATAAEELAFEIVPF